MIFWILLGVAFSTRYTTLGQPQGFARPYYDLDVVDFDAMVEAPKAANYMVLFERHIQPNQPYKVFVQFLKPVSYATIAVDIIYRNGSWYDDKDANLRNHTLASGSLSLTSGKQEGVVELQIPGREQHDFSYYNYMYKAKVRCSGPVNFYEESGVNKPYWRHDFDTGSKNVHVFIQTDKKYYKNGQKVLYRIFVLDKDMKPIDPALNITIKNEDGNKIKEHRNVRGLYGIAGHIQLAEQPGFGTWKIEAEIQESRIKKVSTFEIQSYVLPTYDVNVDLPSSLNIDSTELKGRITAKYTYGKPVTGKVTLTVSKRYPGLFEPKALQTTFDIDGEADFRISTATLLKYDRNLKYDTLRIHANITERETGESYIAAKSVSFFEKPVEIAFLAENELENFKPGFKHTTYLKISQPNEQLSLRPGERLKLGVTYFTDKPSQVSAQFQAPRTPTSNLMTFLSPFEEGSVLFIPDSYLTVPKDGVVKIDLDIPEGVATGKIEATFREQTEILKLEKFTTNSSIYLNLKMKSSFIEVGEQAEFTVTSNSRRGQKITYLIVDDDNKILHFQTTSVSYAFRPTSFYVTMTSEMTPQSKIIAYFYDTENREITADGLEFRVNLKMKNDVSLRFDRSQVSPATNVTLIAQADPNSQVFIKVVDKAAIIMGSGNDITLNEVYSAMGVSREAPWKYQGVYLSKKMSAGTMMAIFEGAGLNFASYVEIRVNRFYPRTTYMTYDSNEIFYMDSTYEAARVGSYMEMPAIRQDFPETWLWLNETVSASGSVNVRAFVPDSITDWVATAFSLNKDTGIGVLEQAVNLTAFLPFHVALHLPFSIVADEVAVIQALVFNYYPHDTYVTVTLRNSSEEFVGLEVDGSGKEVENKEEMSKCVLVKSDDVVSAYFAIKPHKIGTITLEVEAQSSVGRDIIRKDLIVRPAGEQQEENLVHMITLEKENETYTADIPIMYPPRIVPDSQIIHVTVTGDVVGPSLDHLDRLIQMPYGCGEQNMARFAPSVFAATYLNSTGKLSPEINLKVTTILETGYQRQLSYMRRDGSFSAFGQRDSSGSLWLTAFVLKSFAQASGFTYIDPKVMEEGVRYILDHQFKDGTFNSTGFVHNTAMQGGAGKSSKALAAYVLTTLIEVGERDLLENATLKALLRQSTDLTWSFLSRVTGSLTNDYEMAIAAYALALSGKGGDSALLGRLQSSSNFRGETGTYGTVAGPEGKYWYNKDKSQSVETTGYVLLAYALNSMQDDGIQLLKWLVKQRTPYGGFYSTQDTVVALQGLSEFASRLYSTDVNMTVEIDDTINNKTYIHINPDNMDVLQLVNVPPEARYVHVSANGTGTALVEVNIFYNILNGDKNPSFDLRVFTDGNDIDKFTLKSCARWTGAGDSGMVLMEIAFPSGYTGYGAPEKGHRAPDRQEMDRGQLVLYYNQLTNTTCFEVEVTRDKTVGNVQPAMVKVFSYYDADKSVTKFYLPNVLKKSYICDYCGVECGCGYDPDAVPKERCLYSHHVVYPQRMRPYTPVSNTQPQSRQQKQPNRKPGMKVRPGQAYKSSTRRHIIQSPPLSATYPYVRQHTRTSSSSRTIPAYVKQVPARRTFDPDPKPGRSIVPLQTFGTLSQNTDAMEWRRGQTIPVSFGSGIVSGVGQPRLYPQITRHTAKISG